MLPGIVSIAAPVNVQASASLWTPLNMATVPAIYLHAQHSVVTDVDGFCSGITNLGALGSAGDFTQGATSSRPSILAAELNGMRVLRFDGNNDFLANNIAATKDIFRNVSAAWSFVVYKKRGADGTPTTRYIIYTPRNDTAERFSVLVGGGGAGRANKPEMIVRRLDANATNTLLAPDVAQGSYTSVISSINFSNRTGVIRVDGTEVAANATLTPTAGNTSNTAGGSAVSIGAYFTGAVASDVDVAAVILGNVQPTLDEFQRLEGWAHHEFGLTANLPANHPYKTNPPTV
jgi:hypothetical protein